MDGVLILLFFLIALVYSAAGFGGGSLYTAVLSQTGLPAGMIRTASLVCNCLVTGTATIRLAAARKLALRRNLGLLACSIPLVFLTAMLEIPARTFHILLGACLLLAGLAMLIRPGAREKALPLPSVPAWTVYPAAALAGALAGLTGIGGGVYLSPVLYFTRWGDAREIAATTSLFIALNSAAGLAGMLLSGQLVWETEFYWLLAAVFAGGAIGSSLSARIIPLIWLRRLTASILIFAAIRLLIRYL
jgi:uncharacterized protein